METNLNFIKISKAFDDDSCFLCGECEIKTAEHIFFQNGYNINIFTWRKKLTVTNETKILIEI
jgi:hypothetical protein